MLLIGAIVIRCPRALPRGAPALPQDAPHLLPFLTRGARGKGRERHSSCLPMKWACTTITVMDRFVAHKPSFTKDEAGALARDFFGVAATTRPLPSERDQNFLLESETGPEFVLKIANSSETRGILEAQHAVLEHLAQREPSLTCPRIRQTSTGEAIATARSADGSTHLVRMLTYIPGYRFVDVAPHGPAMLESLGRFFGRLDGALAGFSHPALKRHLQWDLTHARSVIAAHLEHVPDPERQALVRRFHERFQDVVEPRLADLRISVIHNDGNDYNVLVTGVQASDGEVTGLIDFGDLVESRRVFELAICTAYAVMGKTDPLGAAAHVVAGYHHVIPLDDLELTLLYDLIAARLCTSVVISARRKKVSPDDPYVTVSEAPAWATLEKLARLSPNLASYTFRQACGLPTRPQTATVVEWLRANQEAMGSVVAPDLRKGSHVIFDVRPGSAELVGIVDPTDPDLLANALFSQMREAGAEVGIGRYGEARLAYTADHYRPAGADIDEWRTMHLGVDLFVEAEPSVFAPLDGTVHSFRNNNRAFDYGPTIILRHEVADSLRFFTLYGHLSEESLEGLSRGMPVSKGSRIGTIGDSSVNGGWPPHLHFQLIMDVLDRSGQFPGVCAARDFDLWRHICPDPNLILQVPGLAEPEPSPSIEETLDGRGEHIADCLSISYNPPVKIVRGWMQYLYDHLGREFLDLVNNVSHVGHCHPRVVRAAQSQMAILNTNTRYLHDSLAEYARRLCATLPESLSVCYFVCSGSEANELALRLARAHTGATDMIVVDGAYHGNTTTLIDISPYKFDSPAGAGAPSYVQKVILPDLYRGPYKDMRDAGKLYADHVREALEKISKRGQRIAAFICESMLSCAGQIVLPSGYLMEAYQSVRAVGGVCIADEIQVGFGRVGSHFWGFQTQDVVPDIVTMGKPMGNGYPVAAVVTTREIAASFDKKGMEYYNTFGGTQVSCAVGLAVLDVIEEQGLQRHARETGAYLKDRLQGLSEKHALIGDVRGEGLFQGVELVRDRDTLEPAPEETLYVAGRLKQLGVLISVDGVSRNVLKIKPPMVLTKTDAGRFTDSLDRVLSEPRLKLFGKNTTKE